MILYVLVLSRKVVFFPQNLDIFSLGEKWKMIFHKKYMKKWLSVYMYRRYKLDIVPPLPPPAKKKPKKAKMILSHKNTPKVIHILDRYPKNSFHNSLYFYGDLYRCFHILLSSEKKQKPWYNICEKTKNLNIIYRIEVWLLLQVFWLEMFYNEESSILCTIQPWGVVFGGVLERQSRKLFVH